MANVAMSHRRRPEIQVPACTGNGRGSVEAVRKQEASERAESASGEGATSFLPLPRRVVEE